MLDPDDIAIILHAIATGFPDRAVNVVAMSDKIDENQRAVLWGALTADPDRSTQARHFGDALRSLGAERHSVNECYRAAFYASDDWKKLSSNPFFAFFSADRSGYPLDKWIHYFPIYERHLARYRGAPVRVLEIGVYRGGGLELLRNFLGPDACLVGIDIDEVARAAARGYEVEIGDQADPEFLQRVSQKHGPFDIVIDDGGHTMRQQTASVEALFPMLKDEGTYLVEDCHTSYWPEYADQGPDGLTFIEWVKARIDDLHAYHYSRSEHLQAPWQTCLDGLHVYDSVVVLTKARRAAPFSELTGTSEFINYPRQTGAIHLEMLATRDAAISRAADLEAETAAVRAQAELETAAIRAQAEVETAAIRAQAEAEGERSREELRPLRSELAGVRSDMARVSADLERLREEHEQTCSDLLGSWGIIREMRQSRSWKMTAPIRRLKNTLPPR